jgi:hypothetical protein
MKKVLVAAFALIALTWGQSAAAQTKQHTETVTKKTGPGPNVKIKTETVTGTVKEFHPGREIEIEGPGGKDFEFDLDENAKIEGTIAVGQTATVHYTKDDKGKEHVVVVSEGAAAKHEMTHSTQAAAAGGNVPPGGKAHMESETKRTGPGPNVKVKSEVVIGTVKEYEPDEKLVVEGPDGKDYKFDLDDDDQQMAIKGSIAKGLKVRVEYTKSEGSERLVVVSLAGELTKPGKKVKG